MQQENRAIAIGQFFDGASQSNSIYRSGKTVVTAAVFTTHNLRVLVIRFIKRNLAEDFLAEVHQHRVDRNPVQPGGKRRITTESGELAENLQKRVLRQIFSFGCVVGHAQADRINSSFVRMKQGSERVRIPLLRAPY